jgi:hypothetical protein
MQQQEVTLGMSIPIDAIEDFLWLGDFRKKKSRCIAEFFKRVKQTADQGVFHKDH